jgi:3-oxochol-4-en-24-oyl-CoA dehydrogenase
MSLALTDDHKALAETAADFLQSKGARAANRALLEAKTEELPSFWKAMADLGWQGLHVPEANGGSGYGIPELLIVVEELGKAVAPGPFVPTVIVSAVLSTVSDQAIAAKLLPGLADGSLVGAFSTSGSVTVANGKASGSAGVVLSGALAQVLLVAVGDDVAVVETAGAMTAVTPSNLDPSRRSSRITLNEAPATIIAGARQTLVDLSRLILAAEAVGLAGQATTDAADYARVRIQFGRPIAMYQGVKHHCANMAVATELAKAAVWDGARAASESDEQRSIAAAMAAALAGPAADLTANLNTQVHGGIAITWEHDAHLQMRRATMLRLLLNADNASADVAALTRKGIKRTRAVELPPEAEAMRDEIRTLAQGIAKLDAAGQRAELIKTGYVMPHWPKPWGRDAKAVEQLVIEQEFRAAGVKKPAYGITGWVILTLIQYGTEDQVARWVMPALKQDVIWCQLFSEPDAGSDAAGITTKATRVDGGWLVTGQKVWTSGAHYAGMGFATVRTDPTAKKHQGITMVVVDMHAKGVEVRPLRQASGHAEFNEVFFNEVFVPDDDVVGPVDGGWTVARATLGNESVSIGGGDGGMAVPGETFVHALDANPDAVAGGSTRIGKYIATHQAMGALNLRSAHRAVAGSEPGPEGAITKLVLSELGHDAAELLSSLYGQEAAFLEGNGMVSGGMVLMHRGLSIAGGTSEIKRNQIGERILGLPRDPLLN